MRLSSSLGSINRLHKNEKCRPLKCLLIFFCISGLMNKYNSCSKVHEYYSVICVYCICSAICIYKYVIFQLQLLQICSIYMRVPALQLCITLVLSIFSTKQNGGGGALQHQFLFFQSCGAPAPSMKCGGVNALTTGQAHCERDFTGRGPRGHYPTSKATYSAAPESRALQSVAAPILHFTNKKLFFYQKS